MAFTSQERKSLTIIASLYLVRMLGLFIVLPVLTIYGSELKDATPVLLGLAIGIYGLTQALLQIPFGWLSDRLGRKPLLIIGFLLFIAGSFLCAFAESVQALIIGRALQGAGAVSAVLLALVADQISAANRTISMAVVGASIGLSFGMSVVLGPLIATNFSGLLGVFQLSASLGILALFLVLFVLPKSPLEDEQKASSENKESSASVIQLAMRPNLLRMDLGIFTVHFMQMCIWVAVPGILVNSFDLPLERHWTLYLATVGGGFFAMLPFMRFWDKRGQVKKSMIVAIAVCILSLVLMQQLTSVAVFIFGLFLFFWGYNLLEATLPSTLTKLANKNSKGTASGVYSSCQFLGVFFGGLTGGWVMQNYAVDTVFLVSACLASIWLISMLPAKNLNQIDD